MRALLDSNVLISYLLTVGRPTTITEIVDAGLLGEYTLLVANRLLQEIAGKVANKRYLAPKITPDNLLTFQETLRGISETIPSIGQPFPAVTRDLKDDHLLAYAVVGQADYLVSGDDDLLVLGDVEGVKIVRPAELLEILQRRRAP